MSLIFIILASISNAIMDVLSARYYVSIFGNLKNKQFWDWNISWKNKWQWGDKANGEKFFLSSTILSFLTDGWHLFKAFMIIFICSAIIFYKPMFGLFDIVLFSCAWGITFELFYNKILIN
jgi:hypothetical protein